MGIPMQHDRKENMKFSFRGMYLLVAAAAAFRCTPPMSAQDARQLVGVGFLAFMILMVGTLCDIFALNDERHKAYKLNSVIGHNRLTLGQRIELGRPAFERFMCVIVLYLGYTTLTLQVIQRALHAG